MSDPVNHNNITLKDDPKSELTTLKKESVKRQKYKNGNKYIVIAFVILLLSYVFSIGFFVDPSEENKNLAFILESGRTKFTELLAYMGGEYIFRPYINLLMYTAIVICGAALASAGAVFQGGFRNIIASPSTMGVQSGATLGNALYILFFTAAATENYTIKQGSEAFESMSFVQMNIQQIFAIIGAFISILIVTLITYSLGRGKLSSANILFAGMIFSTFVGSITSIIQYYFLYNDLDNSRWQSLRLLTMGSFDKIQTPQHLISLAIILIPCLIALIWLSPKLNMLALGEDEAASMGLNVKRYRIIFIGVGSLITGTILAFCGQIGFVGFIVPQAARRLVGNDFKKLVIISMELGGILMIWVYNLASSVGLSSYLNIFTSLLGCSMMLYSFVKGKGGRVHA